MPDSSTKTLSEMTLEELWELFPIRLEPPASCWAKNFCQMKEALEQGLQGIRIARISHIGSTAIRGIWAKPIVDILLELAPGESMPQAAKRLQDMGFICMCEERNRMSFNWGYTPKGFAEKVYHLHLRFEGDNDELYFRDYLNERPKLAARYEALKLDLAKRYEHNRDAYTRAKTEFICKATREAKQLYAGRYAAESR